MKLMALISSAILTICLIRPAQGELKSCSKDAGMTNDDYLPLRRLHFDHVNTKGKCFLHCLYDGVGFMVGDKINPKIKVHIDKGSTECETAFNFFKYYMKKKKEFEVLIKQSNAKEKCLKEANVTYDDVDHIIAGDMYLAHGLKCFLKCIFETVGYMKNGTIDNSHESIFHLGLEKIVKKADACESAYSIYYGLMIILKKMGSFY